MVLAPGAGAGREQPGVVAVAGAVAAAGIRVERIDFPYRLAGRRRPDRPAVLVASIVDATGALARELGVPTNEIAIGGRSMGGRMCSMAVADGLAVAALVLLSYPLHPPGHPERLRIDHFPRIDVPCLFVSGTRDAFGTPEELERATASIAGPVTHVWLKGADHSLRGHEHDAADAVSDWLRRG